MRPASVASLTENPIHISGLVGRAYLTRGAWLWGATRLLAGVLFVVFGADPVRFHPLVSAGIVVLVAALSYIEFRRRREGVFLHNLGVPVVATIFLAAAPSAIGESVISMVGSVMR